MTDCIHLSITNNNGHILCKCDINNSNNKTNVEKFLKMKKAFEDYFVEEVPPKRFVMNGTCQFKSNFDDISICPNFEPVSSQKPQN